MDTSRPAPVRRIGKSGRSINGTFPAYRGIGPLAYESTLERDFYRALLFDLSVVDIWVQPVRLRYQHPNGRWFPYVPDALVFYSDGRPPGLFEVKYVEEVVEKRDLLRCKFRAARHYARSEGHTFALVTEKSIRASAGLLKNMDMLYPFLTRTVPAGDREALLAGIAVATPSTPRLLLEAFPGERKGALLPVLWHLIATKAIRADLTIPLTMDSRVWLDGGA